MIYLASPYSHPDPQVRSDRFHEVRDITARFLASGVPIFSPIAYGRQFELHYEAPSDFRTWQSINDTLVLAATEVWVLAQKGYEVSSGVQHEIVLAQQHSIPVYLLDPTSLKASPL